MEKYFTETKGDGASKLYHRIRQHFVGLSEKYTQNWLNRRQSIQKIRPLFTNRAPLIPIEASQVMERNQIDLVDLRNLAEICVGTKYNYVLSVIDVFSRFLFLRPLETKSSDEIAAHLHNIYNLVGPPRILQSDQGKEFKGAVQKLMARLKCQGCSQCSIQTVDYMLLPCYCRYC